MTALARLQVREMLERLDRVQAVCDAYARHDEAGATALFADMTRLRHRLHGWFTFDDEPKVEMVDNG